MVDRRDDAVMMLGGLAAGGPPWWVGLVCPSVSLSKCRISVDKTSDRQLPIW